MSPAEHAAPAWLPFAIIGGFAVVFPLFWCGIVGALGKFGTWSTAAARYAAPQGAPAPEQEFRWVGGYVGWTQYRGTLTVGLGPRGLHLGTVRFFRVGHPRLLLPWEEVEVGPVENYFFTTKVSVKLPAADGLEISIYGKTAEAVRAAWEKARAQGGVA